MYIYLLTKISFYADPLLKFSFHEGRNDQEVKVPTPSGKFDLRRTLGPFYIILLDPVRCQLLGYKVPDVYNVPLSRKLAFPLYQFMKYI